jgi:hypothetical protein
VRFLVRLAVGVERRRPCEVDFVFVVIVRRQRELRLIIFDGQRAFENFLAVEVRLLIKELFLDLAAIL